MLAADIIAEVARQHGVLVGEIAGPTRLIRVIRARQEAMYRLAAETSLELEEIGRIIGGRDRSTVWHGVRAHAYRNGLVPPRGINSMVEIEKGRPKTKARPWTAAEEAIAAEIWSLPEGLKADEIRRRLPGRSYDSVRKVAIRLGLMSPGHDDEAVARRKAKRMSDGLLELLERHHPEMSPRRELSTLLDLRSGT